MITLEHNVLSIRFPEVHPDAHLSIEFQRTLRIPDDGTDYSLPPGLGPFPLQHVDDYMRSVPAQWLDHGGVILPMYQSEAMWINFDSNYIEDHQASYPFAVKIAAGKIDAVTGDNWTNSLNFGPQNYVVVPEQPWLDGFCVEQGVIRQFVAMPLGQGYSVEEQLKDDSPIGGLQIMVYPMKRKAFEGYYPKAEIDHRVYDNRRPTMDVCYSSAPSAEMEMGLAAGGRMRQQIYDDHYEPGDWDQSTSSRCFVHLANSESWHQITGIVPPTEAPTAKEYNMAGLPWFDYYRERPAVGGSKILRGIKSIAAVAKEKRQPLPDNQPLAIDKVIQLREKLRPNQVREESF